MLREGRACGEARGNGRENVGVLTLSTSVRNFGSQLLLLQKISVIGDRHCGLLALLCASLTGTMQAASRRQCACGQSIRISCRSHTHSHPLDYTGFPHTHSDEIPPQCRQSPQLPWSREQTRVLYNVYRCGPRWRTRLRQWWYSGLQAATNS